MSILFCDTETTGLFRDNIDPMGDEQPHMCQLGAVLYDRQMVPKAKMVVLIRPDGWSIEPSASAVNGLDTATCAKYGVPAASALVTFKGMVASATRIVGHNIQFDRKVIALAIHRAGGEGLWWNRTAQQMVCTMEMSVGECAIPKPSGAPGFKYPKLAEAMDILLPGSAIKPGHNAEDDIACTALIYSELVRRGIIPELEAFGGKKL